MSTNIWTSPVVLGFGKRLFEASAKPLAMHLLKKKASTTGVVMNTYVPVGETPVGSLGQADPGEKELARRRAT